MLTALDILLNFFCDNELLSTWSELLDKQQPSAFGWGLWHFNWTFIYLKEDVHLFERSIHILLFGYSLFCSESLITCFFFHSIGHERFTTYCHFVSVVFTRPHRHLAFKSQRELLVRNLHYLVFAVLPTIREFVSFQLYRPIYFTSSSVSKFLSFQLLWSSRVFIKPDFTSFQLIVLFRCSILLPWFVLITVPISIPFVSVNFQFLFAFQPNISSF